MFEAFLGMAASFYLVWFDYVFFPRCDNCMKVYNPFALFDAPKECRVCDEKIAASIVLRVVGTVVCVYVGIKWFMPAIVRRFPSLQTVGIKRWFNGLESFTEDTNFVLGEARTSVVTPMGRRTAALRGGRRHRHARSGPWR